MGGRRKARALALQALYESDAVRHDAAKVIMRLLEGTELSEENRAFAASLVSGVIQNREEIDRHIRNFARAWPLEQVAIVDRNILRLAIFEILLDNEVSVKVAINEAVELAKTFGSDGSPKFVNGVWAQLVLLPLSRKFRKEENGNHLRTTQEDSSGAARRRGRRGNTVGQICG